jgi:1-acyl-sn-glycerol-3-phosphate acyltransferase
VKLALSPAPLLRRVPFPYRAPTVPRGIEPRARKSRTGANFETEWARSYPARLARVMLLEGVVRPAVVAVARPRRRGLDRLGALEGPAIFAANHHSHIDTPLLLSSIPEPWRHRIVVGAAADYFFTTRVTGTLSALALNAFPIERTRVTRRSADLAATLIGEAWSLLIFPEGGRSPDGWGQPFRGGAGYLAARCDVPVVPVHIEGTGRILGKGKGARRFRPGTTIVTFGSPLRPDEGEDARRFSTRVEGAVTALADEATSDWWSARRRAAAGTSPALTGPTAPAWRRAWALDEGRARRKRRTWLPL